MCVCGVWREGGVPRAGAAQADGHREVWAKNGTGLPARRTSGQASQALGPLTLPQSLHTQAVPRVPVIQLL